MDTSNDDCGDSFDEDLVIDFEYYQSEVRMSTPDPSTNLSISTEMSTPDSSMDMSISALDFEDAMNIEDTCAGTCSLEETTALLDDNHDTSNVKSVIHDFKIVFDNINVNVTPRYMSFDNQTTCYNSVHLFAVKDRIDFSELSTMI